MKGELLCFGGQQENGIPINTMHSLNLYQSWNTTDPAWSMIEPTNNDIILPTAFSASTFLSNSNNFFVDGGLQSQRKSQTIYYDTFNGIWMNPIIKGPPLIKR